MSRANGEFRLQCVVVDYLTACVPDLLWTAFPAGEFRTAATGARIKRMGLAPGWPDIIAVLPGGRFLGLELKAERGRLSNAQEAVQRALDARGAVFRVVRSLDDVRAVLAEHDVPTRERMAA